ncbi:MAG TPA: DUF3850 domain-containing protein, partial [Fibrella sp.]
MIHHLHILKVHPQFWPSLIDGSRTFDVRRDDRKYKVGDCLQFELYDPKVGRVGEVPERRVVTYILAHEDFPQGVGCGFVVLGFTLFNANT